MLRYMKFKAYGDADANTDRVYPTNGWSSSLEQYKKSISKFMMYEYHYDDENSRGNPTKSKRVTNLIKVVKRHEVQGNGRVRRRNHLPLYYHIIGERFQL